MRFRDLYAKHDRLVARHMELMKVHQRTREKTMYQRIQLRRLEKLWSAVKNGEALANARSPHARDLV